MTLMYNSANERPVSFLDLARIPTPPPLGRFHNPVPFFDYAQEVRDAAEARGFEVVRDQYAVSKDDQRMFGLIEVAPREGEYISAREWSTQIGVRGSHDQRMPRGLTFGSQVLVCSNMCFHGDLGTFQTRQTTNINQRLPGLISEAMNRLPGMLERNQRRFDRYHEVDIRPRWGDAALVELHRRQALSSAQLGRAIQEWDSPSYEEHAEDGRNVWRLFNAATQALKPTGERGASMELLRERSERVSHFLDEVVDL